MTLFLGSPFYPNSNGFSNKLVLPDIECSNRPLLVLSTFFGSGGTVWIDHWMIPGDKPSVQDFDGPGVGQLPFVRETVYSRAGTRERDLGLKKLLPGFAGSYRAAILNLS